MHKFSEKNKVLLDAHLLLVNYYNDLCDKNKENVLCEETEYIVNIINKLSKLFDKLDIDYLKYYEQLD